MCVYVDNLVIAKISSSHTKLFNAILNYLNIRVNREDSVKLCVLVIFTLAMNDVLLLLPLPLPLLLCCYVIHHSQLFHKTFSYHPNRMLKAFRLTQFVFRAFEERDDGPFIFPSSFLFFVTCRSFIYFEFRIFTERLMRALYLSEILLFCVLLKRLLFCY